MKWASLTPQGSGRVGQATKRSARMHSLGVLRRCQMLAIALVVGALALGISAPSQAAFAAAGHQTWNVTVGAESANGVIQGMIFTPSEIFVKAGDTIVWTVGAKEIHTVA